MDWAQFTHFSLSVFTDRTHPANTLLRCLFWLFVVLFCHFVSRHLLKKLSLQLEKKRRNWLQSLINAGIRPIAVFIWFLYGLYVLNQFFTQILPDWLDALSLVRTLGFIVLSIWFLFEFIHRVEKIYLSTRSQKRLDPSFVRVISRIAQLSVVLIGILTLLNNLGVSVASLTAISSVGAAGIAFAAQGILGNFFGGLLLYVNRTFVIGEAISSPDRAIEGTVENIGWLVTAIRNADQRPIYVPNSLFLSIIVINITRMTNRRIVLDLPVRYQDGDKLGLLMPALQSYIQAYPGLDKEKTNLITLNKFTASLFNLNVVVFTPKMSDPEFFAIQQDLLLGVRQILQQHGAEYGLPGQSLYLEKVHESKAFSH